MYANIIIDISHEKLDRTFQYRIPEKLLDQIHPGTPVEIPFGRSNRKIRGYVVEVTEEPEFAPERIKPVSHVIREGIPIEGQLIALAAWMRENFGGTMNQALKTVLPVKQKTTEKEQRLIWLKPDPTTAKSLLGELQRKHQTARARLLEALLEQSPLPYETVTQKLNITVSVIRAMQERELIRVESIRSWRNPLDQMKKQGTVVTLNPAQQQIVTGIENGWRSGDERPCLLHGVTGSGKTSVFIKLIKSVMDMGKTAVMLVPEISLTPQMLGKFKSLFGDKIAVMHSSLSLGQRTDEFKRVMRGEARIVIGTRSAIFAPVTNVGIIIMDEEGEPSYKSDSTPRYHARDVAIQRCGYNNCVLLMASATPSLESFYYAQKGRYHLFELKNRYSKSPLPAVEIVDMQEEAAEGNDSLLSRVMCDKLTEVLAKKEQAILLLNRRGYTTYITCMDCRQPVACPNCNIPLTYHKKNDRYMCHYCGYTMDNIEHCPQCGSQRLKSSGVGTQRVEDELERLFPQARLLRMDADTTSSRYSYEENFKAFEKGEYDIMLGTQMIAKGLNFPNVTMVGVISLDKALFTGDFRSYERTFSLLTQVAGRSGRGDKPGVAYIQTFVPDHYNGLMAQFEPCGRAKL